MVVAGPGAWRAGCRALTLLTIEHKSSQNRPDWTPKEFELGSGSDPKQYSLANRDMPWQGQEGRLLSLLGVRKTVWIGEPTSVLGSIEDGDGASARSEREVQGVLRGGAAERAHAMCAPTSADRPQCLPVHPWDEEVPCQRLHRNSLQGRLPFAGTATERPPARLRLRRRENGRRTPDDGVVRDKSRRALLLLLLVTAMALGLVSSGCRTIRAARILRDAQRPAHELMEGVHEGEALGAGVSVRLYWPSGGSGPWPTLLLCHGAVDAGPHDPRLIALARALARHGVFVACPELRSLSSFQVDPRDIQHLVDVTRWLERLPERGDERLSMVGISIGGSYCIVAASRREVREDVSAVLALGAYENLERLITSWLVTPERDAPELYDPLVEGRRRVLLGNLEGLVPAQDQDPIRRALLALLRGEDVRDEYAGQLSPAGRRLLACARSTEPIDRGTAAAVLTPLSEDLRALSPGGDGNTPTACVFLLHGEEDPIVPPSEIAILEAELEEADTWVRSHVTGAFTHVGAGASGSFLQSWSLLRFLAAFLKAAGA